jgi:hypothetical protein
LSAEAFCSAVNPVSSTANSTGPLDHLAVGAIVLDKFEITEKIVGISINVADITNAVRGAIKTVMQTFLVEKAFLPGPNGTQVTVLEWLNAQPVAAPAFKAICSANQSTVGVAPGASVVKIS